MLKKRAAVFRRLMILADTGIIAGAFFLGYFLRNKLELLYPVNYYIWVLPVFLSLLVGSLYSFGMYSSFRLKRILEILFIILKATFLSFLAFSSLSYLFKTQYISRTFIIIIFSAGAIAITLEKIILMYFFRHLRKKGFNFRNLLIVGTGPRAQRFVEQVDRNKEFGLKIVGFIDENPSKTGEEIQGHKVLGTLVSLPNILGNKAIDHVFFIVPRSWLEIIEEAVLYCETMGIAVSIAVDLFNLKFTMGKETNLLGLPFLIFETTSDKAGHLLIKRMIDILVSFVALVVLAPLFLVVAVLIKLTSVGQVFFQQERCTLNGRRFTLYKFRTMTHDAEDKLQELLKYNEMEGPAFKMEKDPRVTPIGRFLRKTSLDELPQLWNVLKGDISLVGPRPPLPQEVAQYDCWQRRRLSMRPGITCLWQVNGRNQITDFNRWAKYDLEYIDHWSLILDFKILLKTIPAVLFGLGAK